MYQRESVCRSSAEWRRPRLHFHVIGRWRDSGKRRVRQTMEKRKDAIVAIDTDKPLNVTVGYGDRLYGTPFLTTNKEALW